MEDVIPQLCGIETSSGKNVDGSAPVAGPTVKDGVLIFPDEVQAAIDQVCWLETKCLIFLLQVLPSRDLA